jgi:hypothetical protein
MKYPLNERLFQQKDFEKTLENRASHAWQSLHAPPRAFINPTHSPLKI